jgi:hypothetical protein
VQARVVLWLSQEGTLFGGGRKAEIWLFEDFSDGSTSSSTLPDYWAERLEGRVKIADWTAGFEVSRDGQDLLFTPGAADDLDADGKAFWRFREGDNGGGETENIPPL